MTTTKTTPEKRGRERNEDFTFFFFYVEKIRMKEKQSERSIFRGNACQNKTWDIYKTPSGVYIRNK